MNIIRAIKDENLFRHFLGDDLGSWRQWMTALRALYGLPIRSRMGTKLVRGCTGRDAEKLSADGFDTALFLVGRRSGKSRTAATIGAFESVLSGRESRLAKGEKGLVAILSPSRLQSRVPLGYLRSIFSTPMLRNEVVAETKDGFDLRNGVRVEILPGDWRTVRAYTLLAAIVDEACFFGVEAESKVKSDTELIRALRPGLSTTGGKLVCISSPYAQRGWCYQQWKRHFGNDKATTLVWNCPSRVMNPTLPQKVVDDALRDDLQAAKSEYLGEFRDDVCTFLPRDVIETLVVPGRYELLPDKQLHYMAFADLSGGRADDAALAVAHKEDRTVVIDLLRRYKPPHNPHEVIRRMVEEAKRFRVARVTGDNYAAEFCAASFEGNNVFYERCEKTKSELYGELLPRMCSGELELLDDDTMVDQLANLERRTRSGGKDVIDHPSRGKDDLANAVAGATVMAASRLVFCGAI